MSPLEKQRLVGVIALALAALMVAAVIGLEAWAKRPRKPRFRCGDPGCRYCDGTDRTVQGLVDQSFERPNLRSVQ